MAYTPLLVRAYAILIEVRYQLLITNYQFPIPPPPVIITTYGTLGHHFAR